MLNVEPLRIAAPPVFALVLSLIGSIAIFGQARLVPDGPPYFLGRLIASGPALNYLRDACARGERYELCADLDNFPRETWQVLWLPSSPLRTHAGFRAEVMAEADAIVYGTILAYPIQVLRNALYATRRQFVTIASELVIGPDTGQIASWNPYAEAGFRNSRQADGLAASGQMAPFNQIHRVVYLLATGLMLLAIVPLWRQGLRPLAVLIAVTIAALAGNAFLTGVISDIAGRYQGRIAWLPTLLTVSAPVLLWRMRATMRRPRL